MKTTKQTNKLDKGVYWITQIVLSVLAAAGIWSFLQPIDPVLAIPLTVILVANLFYISIKNR
jgi:hypothetical protein